jgi:hypothetical protein
MDKASNLPIRFQESLDGMRTSRDALWRNRSDAVRDADRLKVTCSNLQPKCPQDRLTPMSLSALPQNFQSIVASIHQEADRITTLDNEIARREDAIANLRAEIDRQLQRQKTKRALILWAIAIGAVILIAILIAQKG